MSSEIISVKALNWSREIDLPLLEVAIIEDSTTLVAGRTHLFAAQYISTECTDASFHTSHRYRGPCSIEIMLSKEKDCSIPGKFTELKLIAMKQLGASAKEIAAQAKINQLFQQKYRRELMEDPSVKVSHMGIREPVTIFINIYNSNETIDKDHAEIKVVSKTTGKLLGQRVVIL